MAGSPTNLLPVIHFMANFCFAFGEGSALLRIWTKAVVLKSYGWDDFAMTIAALINIGQHAILYIFVDNGAGLPTAEVMKQDPMKIVNMQKLLFTEEIYYVFLHFCIKMSFLLFFLRLSPATGFRRAVWSVIGINIFVTVGVWILYCLQCQPIEAYWNKAKYPDVKCLPFAVSLWLPACALIAVDFAILILPLTTIMTLQMSFKRRLQVLAVITTGGTSVLVSCLRLIVINEFTKTPDFTWEVGIMIIVSAAEMETAIFAANMPALRALWKTWRGGGLTTNGSSPGASKGYNMGGGSSSNGHGTGSRGHQLSNLFPNRSAPKGAERLEDDYSKAEDGSSTRELTRRADSDEELALKDNGMNKKNAIVVTRGYDIQEHQEEPRRGQGQEHTWSSPRVNTLIE